ncbi:ETS-related transcription factor Elf-5 isoform X3 [Hyla sarda]|uniref:ETS-related transcription factor Elf-5 isoform X3 n=1 Tax=Hyla sarda TaxID=327740 RepID=UPI0024C46D0B|nr:ETS-related transcription factor Elf-5 isoform X3 [Hyla sarda]
MVMIDSSILNPLMPSYAEAHFSWTDLFCNDLYTAYRDPSPDVLSQWSSLPPEHWSKHHVFEWLQYCCDNHKLDATCIPFSRFNVTGMELCNMTKEDFTESAGACGHFLYSLLQEIRTHGIPLLSGREEAPPSQSTDRDDKVYLKSEPVKRHRQPNQHRPGIHSSHLWEFVRDLLLSPEENDGILDWEDQEQGIFRVVKSEALARMWGQKKRNDRMNYEKLSRALRHYYKTGILERVDKRLVYKFGKNAYGWHRPVTY